MKKLATILAPDASAAGAINTNNMVGTSGVAVSVAGATLAAGGATQISLAQWPDISQFALVATLESGATNNSGTDFQIAARWSPVTAANPPGTWYSILTQSLDDANIAAAEAAPADDATKIILGAFLPLPLFPFLITGFTTTAGFTDLSITLELYAVASVTGRSLMLG